MTSALRLKIPKEVYPSELAAVFVSALAYPTDVGRRNEFATALLGLARDANLKEGKEIPLAITWLLSQIDRRKLSRALDAGLEKISRERLIAAKMAFPRVDALFCDVAGVPRPEKVPMPTSADMMAAVSVDLDERRSSRGRRPIGGAPEGNEANIKTRQWKSSLPALHLALSYHYECIDSSSPVSGLSLGDLFFDAECSDRLIRRSIDLQGLVRDLFPIDSAEQFQFIYAN